VVEQVGGLVVVGEIPKLVNAKESWSEVVAQPPSPKLWGIGGVELVEHVGGGANEHGVTIENGLMSDVFEEHCFSDAVGSEQDEVASLTQEVEGDGGLDESTIDFLGPVPVEVCDGLESSELGAIEPTFEASARFVVGLDSGELLEDLDRGELFLSCSGEKVIEIFGEMSQAEPS